MNEGWNERFLKIIREQRVYQEICSASLGSTIKTGNESSPCCCPKN